MADSGRLVWIDMEMTGLDPGQHVTLEIATLITDADLEVLAEGPVIAVARTAEGVVMTPETIAVIGAAIALAGLILPGQWAMRRDIGDLRERMTRLEGLFEGFTKREATRETAP